MLRVVSIAYYPSMRLGILLPLRAPCSSSSPLASRLFVARTHATARPLESRVAALERDSKGVIDLLSEMKTEIVGRLDSVEGRLDAMEGRLDANTKAIQDVDKRLTGQLQGIDKRLTGQLQDVKGQLHANTRSIEQLARKSEEMKAGMGKNFELFTATCIKDLLAAKDPALENVVLQQGRIFIDKAKTVNPRSFEFEVDLFSLEPGIVVEVTTYVRREEKDKWERLALIREYFKREYQRDVQIFLVCLAMDPTISKKVADFCRANGITLLSHRT